MQGTEVGQVSNLTRQLGKLTHEGCSISPRHSRESACKKERWNKLAFAASMVWGYRHQVWGARMLRFSYAVSAILAFTGTAIGLFGVFQGEMKPFVGGFVLLSAASVFALLYLGARRLSPSANDSLPPGASH
jgi:hypothetical protein